MFADGDIRELVSFAGQALILRVIGVTAGLAFNIALARYLGADGAGIYFLSVTIIAIMGVICRLGLENVVLRETSACLASDRKGRLVSVAKRSIVIVAGVSAIASLLLVLLAGWLSERIFHKPELADTLRIMSLSLLPTSLYLLHAEILRGARRIGQAAIVKGVVAQIAALMLLVILVRSRNAISVTTVSGIYVVAALIGLMLSILYLYRARLLVADKKCMIRTRWLLEVGRPMFIIAMMGMAMNWVDTICLGVWRTAGEVGIYNAAIRTARMTSFILVAVNSIAAPKYSALFTQGRLGDLERVARLSSLLMILATLPLLVIFLAAPETVMGLFGVEFREAAGILRILAIGQLVNVATGSIGFILLMTGQEKPFQNIMLIFVALNVLLNILLVPPLGIAGAAIASSLSVAGQNVAAVVVGKRKLGVNVLPIGTRMIADG